MCMLVNVDNGYIIHKGTKEECLKEMHYYDQLPISIVEL